MGYLLALHGLGLRMARSVRLLMGGKAADRESWVRYVSWWGVAKR